jgi:hypothetical protein
MTVSQGYAEWAATRKNLSPNSRAVEGVMWSSWILPVIGNVRIQRFTQRDYERLDDALIAQGLTEKSRRNARATLQERLRRAERDRTHRAAHDRRLPQA